MHQIIGPFESALASSRLFMIPTTTYFHHFDDGMTVYPESPTNNTPTHIPVRWWWSDTFACDNYTLAFQPWNCQFMPITNCSADVDLRHEALMRASVV